MEKKVGWSTDKQLATTNYKPNAGLSRYLNESELNNDSDNLKRKVR